MAWKRFNATENWESETEEEREKPALCANRMDNWQEKFR